MIDHYKCKIFLCDWFDKKNPLIFLVELLLQLFRTIAGIGHEYAGEIKVHFIEGFSVILSRRSKPESQNVSVKIRGHTHFEPVI